MSIHRLEFEDFPFGPGLFETIRLENGSPVLLKEHWERLSASCRSLGFALPFAMDEVERRISSKAKKQNGRLRLIYKNEADGPILKLQILKAKPIPDSWTLLLMVVKPHPLAAHKTTDRRVYEDWLEEAARKGADDALLMTADGEILETTRANIFAVIDGDLRTPPADGRILPGIMRSQVIQSAKKRNVRFSEKIIHKEDLKKATEIFVTNSVIGLMPVVEKNLSGGSDLRHRKEAASLSRLLPIPALFPHGGRSDS